jgi:hypothetical protein
MEMLKKMMVGLTLASTVLSAPLFAAEDCNELAGRLTFNANGTITDSKTGLVWSQCNLGQEWKGGQCTGNRTKNSFDDAVNLIQSSGLASQGYRLPTLAELLDITAYQCGEPAVHSSWTSIESDFYWTSTEAFGGFKNTVLMTTAEEYPMSSEIDAWSVLVK